MKYGLIVALILCGALLLSACSKAQKDQASDAPPRTESSSDAQNEDAYQKITAKEAKEMMDRGGVSIVDVRTAKEYEQAHIPGAILVPNQSIGDEPIAALPDKEALLIVYCRTGVRSKQASDKLVALGYRHIYDMGGIVDWSFETESGAAK